MPSLFLNGTELSLNESPDFEEQKGDVGILQEALDLGIVDHFGNFIEVSSLQEADKTVRRAPNYSTEVKKVTLTKDSKFAKLVSRTCVLLAKQNKDSNYEVWKKHMTAAKEAKKAMELKYNSAAQKRAKEIIANSKKLITKATADLPKTTTRPST